MCIIFFHSNFKLDGLVKTQNCDLHSTGLQGDTTFPPSVSWLFEVSHTRYLRHRQSAVVPFIRERVVLSGLSSPNAAIMIWKFAMDWPEIHAYLLPESLKMTKK